MKKAKIFETATLPRVGSRWKIGPSCVDYNGLMYRLEQEGRTLIIRTPRYGLFGRLKGYYAYVSYKGNS